jgi:hypothetical protein
MATSSKSARRRTRQAAAGANPADGVRGTKEQASRWTFRAGRYPERRSPRDRCAAMVSNLLVVLCSEHPTQPVVSTGTLYQ